MLACNLTTYSFSDEQTRYMEEKRKEGLCITPIVHFSEEIPLRWTGVKADDVEKAIARFWPDEMRNLDSVLVRD